MANSRDYFQNFNSSNGVVKVTNTEVLSLEGSAIVKASVEVYGVWKVIIVHDVIFLLYCAYSLRLSSQARRKKLRADNDWYKSQPRCGLLPSLHTARAQLRRV